MHAAGTLYPSVIPPGIGADGENVYRLGALAAANGIALGKAHDAAHDVDAMLQLCRRVKKGAPDLWSAFLRFSSKARRRRFDRPGRRISPTLTSTARPASCIS
jgi:exodeoxyribonuclease I